MKQSYNQLAELTGMSYRTIKKKISAAGIEPEKGKGNTYLFDSKTVLPVLYKTKESLDELDLQEERAKLAREQTRAKKRENDIEDGLVAPVSLLTDALTKTCSQLIPVLDALPMEMKRRNPRLQGHDILLVKKSIAKCRNTMATMEIDLSQ